ncbi:MAG: hypothetical protein QCI38_03070 [Candidatus Thermoplasmatota archaeon]|nr:hypothetical protein [Candidatus Thermoplasmatota archaeon]
MTEDNNGNCHNQPTPASELAVVDKASLQATSHYKIGHRKTQTGGRR